MATFIFDGTQNVTVPNFDPQNDTVVIDGFDIADVESFSQSNSSVTLTLASGVVLTLNGVIFASLADTNFVTGTSTDIDIAFAPLGGGTAAGNLIVGSAGTDTLNIVATETTGAIVYGQQGVDNIDANDAEDVTIFAGQGNDVVTEVGSNALVYGNDGRDSITLTTAAGETATVFGGSNVVGADDGIDTILGGAGDHLIYGNAGNDVLTGGTGDDTIFGGQDDDLIDGGAGDNVLYGNLGDDSITGGTGDSTIFGGQDNDSLTGGSGDEAIYGNLGNDIIITSTGVDTLVGGAGDDSIGGSVAAVGGAVSTGNLVAGSEVYGGLGDDVISLTIVSGAAGAQTSIFGGNNLVGSADGDDLITVAGTVDASIFGNQGNDTIVGGVASNEIFGGEGNDSLTGGSADDEITTVTGGLGNDIFVAGTDVATAGTDVGYTIVTDFTKGSDTIEFTVDPTSFSTITVGAATSYDTVAEVIGAFNSQLDVANEAIAVIVQSGELAGHTVVLANTTGASAADAVIVLTGTFNNLDLTDFS